MIPTLKDVGAEQYIKEVDWEQLKKRHSIVIEGNRATVSVRRWPLGDKPLFTATAFLGTKAVDIKLMNHKGGAGHIVEWDVQETLSESNVTSELEVTCMIFLGELDAAQRFVNAE